MPDSALPAVWLCGEKASQARDNVIGEENIKWRSSFLDIQSGHFDGHRRGLSTTDAKGSYAAAATLLA